MDELSANPFVFTPKINRMDYLFFILMFPIACLRVILLIPIIVLLFLSSFLFYTIKQIIRPTNYYEVKQYFMTVPMFFMLTLFFLMGVRITQISDYNKKKNSANLYIFAPHSSMFDILVLFKLGVISAVAREETRNLWFFSKFILLTDPILVKRDNSASRQETIKQIKLRAKYDKVAIFPEGTCTNRSSIIKFRLGAFTPGLPVQPVYIDYAKDTDNNTIWSHEGPSSAKLFLLTLFKWQTRIKVHLLPVYSPVREEIEEPWQFGHNVQNYFCDYFNLRKSLYSFEDPKFLAIAKNKGIPRSPSCLKLVKICFKVMSLSSLNGKQNQSNHTETINVKPVTETTSSQIIALKIKKSSIGSINSVVETNVSWVDELDTFLKNFIFYSLDKLNAISDLRIPINSCQSLIKFLELDKKYPGIEHSSTLDDFYNTVSGLRNKKKMTYLDLYIILTLCNLSTFYLKDRIDNCILKMENIRRGQIKDHVINYSNFCKLIWHLIGIDESLIPESIFKYKRINSDFFKKEIVQTFRTAVFENAPDLISVTEFN